MRAFADRECLGDFSRYVAIHAGILFGRESRVALDMSGVSQGYIRSEVFALLQLSRFPCSSISTACSMDPANATPPELTK